MDSGGSAYTASTRARRRSERSRGVPLTLPGRLRPRRADRDDPAATMDQRRRNISAAGPDRGAGPLAAPETDLTLAMHALADRLHALNRSGRGRGAAGVRPEVLLDAARGLASALEELQVAQDELITTRADLEAERARYRELFQFAPDGYLVTAPGGQILEANVALARMLNAPDRLVIGKPLSGYVHPSDRATLTRLLRRMRHAGGDDRGEATLRLVPRGGSPDLPTFAHLTVGAVRTSARSSSAMTLRWIVRDVSARHRAEQELAARGAQLRRLAYELTRAEELERRRIAAAIHDRVSQSLAMAKLKVALLRESLGPAMSAEQSRQVDEVTDMLGRAVQETRSLTFELSLPVLYELGFVPAVEWLADEVRRRDPRLAVRVTALVRDGVPVDDARVLLFQAVRELLTNAVKHAKACRVDVTIGRPDGAWRVTVADNGVGMPPPPATGDREAAPAAKKGRRAAAKAKQPAAENGGPPGWRGAGGFGLFSIRTRLEQSGGRMEVESAPGRGTRVTLLMEPSRDGNGGGAHDLRPTDTT